MDADSLYAAGAASTAYHQPYAQQYPMQLATAQSLTPYVYYIVPDANTQPAQPALSGEERLASLAPGVEWQFTNFQEGAEEVPPLPDGPANNLGTDGETPTFGEQQERLVAQIEESPLAFLRAQSVLLDPGERQIDVGMEYAIVDGFVFNVGSRRLAARGRRRDVDTASTPAAASGAGHASLRVEGKRPTLLEHSIRLVKRGVRYPRHDASVV